MKLFRISNVKEFFDTFPKATTILNQAEHEFSTKMETVVKNISVPSQINFSGKIVHISVRLQNIVFVGEHELYYYDISEQTDK